MLFTVLRKVPPTFFTLLRSRLPSWLSARLSRLVHLLLPFSSMLQCPDQATKAIMDDYPERADCLEPLKTLHETRANDQYGK